MPFRYKSSEVNDIFEKLYFIRKTFSLTFELKNSSFVCDLFFLFDAETIPRTFSPWSFKVVFIRFWKLLRKIGIVLRWMWCRRTLKLLSKKRFWFFSGGRRLCVKNFWRGIYIFFYCFLLNTFFADNIIIDFLIGFESCQMKRLKVKTGNFACL